MVELDPMLGLIAQTPKYFRHQDGGIYRYIGLGTHTLDLADTVAYYHIWPFEQKMWFRNQDEWNEPRFVEISLEDVFNEMKKDKAESQKAVAAAKVLRKAIPIEAFVVASTSEPQP